MEFKAALESMMQSRGTQFLTFLFTYLGDAFIEVDLYHRETHAFFMRVKSPWEKKL